MSLVTGIDVGGWSASIANGGPTPAGPGLALEALFEKGLPDSGTNHYRATFDLSAMHTCSIEEYAYSMGFPDAEDANHGAWTFKHEEMRVVLPALALIRALIGEHPTCFSRLFRPQSLDDIYEFAPTNAMEQVRVSNLLGPAKVTNRAELRRRLTWFACFPSARLAWASVYGHAKNGRLDIALPKLTVNAWLRGQRLKNNFYTTKLQIQDVVANERPYEFATHCATAIDFIGDGRRIMQSTKSVHSFHVPMRGDQSSLSDEEWERVRPLFSKDPSQEVSRRETLDAILLKWSKHLTWNAIEEMLGKNEGTTSSYYYKWRIDGRISKLMDTLREMRGHSNQGSGSASGDPTTKLERPCDQAQPSLSQTSYQGRLAASQNLAASGY